MEAKSIEFLESIGWYPERKRDMSYVFNLLKSLGYSSPSKELYKIMQRYWDLAGSFQQPNGWFEGIELMVDRGVENITLGRIKQFEEIVGVPLIPVGTYFFLKMDIFWQQKLAHFI